MTMTGEATAQPVDPVLIQRSYDLYGDLTENYGSASPQHQGLTDQEFGAALGDSAVAKTVLEKDGQPFLLPQVGPVDRNQWLNPDFYARNFPDEYARGDVLHFVDIPEVEPGEEVQSRIRDLAANGGVLTFDYPLSDSQYPERISSLLASLGVEVEIEQELGNQTYFAGQIHLTKGSDPRMPILGFQEAFKKFVREGGYDPARIKNGASVISTVPEDQAHVMRDFYDEAYQDINNHPCRQGLDADEFMEMVMRKDWVTKVVNSRDGRITALVLLDNDLTELSWVNASYYEEHYPDKYKKGQVVWFPGLAADPNSDVGGNTKDMVRLMAELCEAGNNDVLVVFDCCDKNTGFLDQVLERLINDSPETSIKFETMAVQRYMALKLKAA